MAIYADETINQILGLLDERTEVLAAVRGKSTERCPACGVLVIKGQMRTHAHAFPDDHHAVVEVMES